MAAMCRVDVPNKSKNQYKTDITHSNWSHCIGTIVLSSGRMTAGENMMGLEKNRIFILFTKTKYFFRVEETSVPSTFSLIYD